MEADRDRNHHNKKRTGGANQLIVPPVLFVGRITSSEGGSDDPKYKGDIESILGDAFGRVNELYIAAHIIGNA